MAAAIDSPPVHPSTTLVNVADDADARLVRVLAPGTSDPAKFEAACGTAVSNGDAASLLGTMVSSGAIAGLLGDAYSVDEAVSAFSLLTVYLNRAGDDVSARELCKSLADEVGRAAGGDDAKRREKQSAMVAALFNLRNDAGEKVELLAKIIDLADVSAVSPGQPKGVAVLADLLDSNVLKSTMKLWGETTTNAELRSLYKSVTKAMERVLAKLSKDDQEDKTIALKIKKTEERKQTYMLLFLETYTDESSLDSDANTYAQEAATGAIRDPINLFSSQRGILSLPAISALQKSQPGLYDLLKIFVSGKLQDYRDFASMPDKMAVFSAYKLSEDDCTKNMSLLSLVSLAGEHEEIPYSAIASTLGVEEDDVEKWVIAAVASGLMEAKMDQLSKVVIVERCAVRQFGTKEWSALKLRLEKYKTNVKGVLDALEKSAALTEG